MNFKKAFGFLVSLLLTGSFVMAQQAVPPPPASPSAPMVAGEPLGAFSLFIEGGSFLGVHAEDVNKENMGRYALRDARGVGITQIVKDSPAEKAGLRKDDVILRFEGDSVTSVRKLNRLVSEVAPDQSVKLGISRGGSEQEVAVTIGKRDQSFNAFNRLEDLRGLQGGMEGFKALEGLKGWEGPKGLPDLKAFKVPDGNGWKWEGQGPGNDGFVFQLGNNRRMGVTTVQLTKQLADYFGIADGKGVLVTTVSDDSPAAKAGVKAGDVITSVDGESIEGPGDLSRAINKNKEGDVSVVVVRDKKQRTIKVTPDKAANTLVRPGRVSNRVIRDEIRTAIKQGVANGQVVIPNITIPAIPAINISTPRIEMPVIPEIRIVVPKVRVVRTGTSQII